MSDHNPQDVEAKRLPFAEAAAGAIGLETMLPAALRLVHNGEIGLQDADPGDVDAPGRTARPARRHRCARARRPTSIVIDPDTPWVLDPAELKSQCKNTPFDEARFTGRVVRTIVGGRTVYEHV